MANLIKNRVKFNADLTDSKCVDRVMDEGYSMPFMSNPAVQLVN